MRKGPVSPGPISMFISVAHMGISLFFSYLVTLIDKYMNIKGKDGNREVTVRNIAGYFGAKSLILG